MVVVFLGELKQAKFGSPPEYVIFGKVTIYNYVENPKIPYIVLKNHQNMVCRSPKALYMILCATFFVIYRSGAFKKNVFRKSLKKKWRFFLSNLRKCSFFLSTPHNIMCQGVYQNLNKICSTIPSPPIKLPVIFSTRKILSFGTK